MLSATIFVFILAIFAALLYDRAKRVTQLIVVGALTGILFFFGSFYSQIIGGREIVEQQTWIPSLDIGLDMYLDGLSYFFVWLILGIGLLVVLYAFQYMREYREKGRFFAFLLFFMGSMLGLVLSANLISLFVFWELTSLSSFLLIGFQNTKKESRDAARQALLVTAGGGLAMLAGLILLSLQAGNTFQLLELLNNSLDDPDSKLVIASIVLIIIGAATKSAQFPFHFWLPNAMAAPTPVSAYLHSATMVKAGVYLLLRLNPVFESIDFWRDALGIIGAVTMTYAAYRSIQEDDLKKILAYTTISALGIFFMMIGVGGEEALNAVLVYILAHALYKGTLFLTAGGIDHSAGTRNVSELFDLRSKMPWTSGAMLLALASMAGLIPLLGFVGKEALYDVLYHNKDAISTVFLVLLFLAGALFTAVGIDISKNAIFSTGQSHQKKFGEAGVLMFLAPTLLAVVGLVLGVLPGSLVQPLLSMSAADTFTAEASMHLKLWHGFNFVLLLSVLTILAGFVIYKVRHLPRKGRRPEWLTSGYLYDGFMKAIDVVSKVSTSIIQNGLLRNYIAVTILTFSALLCFVLLEGGLLAWPDSSGILFDLQIYEVVIILLITIATGYLFKTKSKLIVTATFGIIGYSIALSYVLFSAPDVAITQFLAETLTLILLILILHRLPSYTLRKRIPNQWYLPISIVFGLLMTTISYILLNATKEDSLKNSILKQSLSEGKGQNAVNIILVDFRAFDTFGEITVLAVTMLGIIALLRFKRESSDL